MKKLTLILLGVLFITTLFGCKNNDIERVEDLRNLSPYAYTVANLGATDALGRNVRGGDEENDNYVGLFYHVWHGYHTTGIYNISELIEYYPGSLYNIEGDSFSPLDQFHYWGEPLYGYYSSKDPWVITRHIELLTMAGVDYLVYDLTNSVIYVDAINALFQVLQTYQDQGFDVPKVAFYTNSGSRFVINRVYELWYKDGLYEDLWFSFDDKPLIIGVSSELTPEEKSLYLDFFDFRESQWPYGYDQDLERGFPWMDWDYPQTNYNGTMSVSLAQHPGARMSEEDRSNNGRGFDYTKFMNVAENAQSGSNFDGQWQTVYNNRDSVNNVFITGFNEWIAIKMSDGQSVFFVDTFNEEYSRDIEMMKNGYGDNYYLQTIDHIRNYKYTEAKHYIYPQTTIDITDATYAAWANAVANFKDFAGDALARNHLNTAGSAYLTDSSNRNDITDVSITHDKNNVYIKVQTLDPITPYNGSDLNWMNVMIKTDDALNSFAGYNFVINRSPDGNQTSIEKSLGGYNFEKVGNASYTIFGNVIQFSIPLQSLGLSAKNVSLQFKVADNVTHFQDIMDYYVSGDSAPIGRLNYRYGY